MAQIEKFNHTSHVDYAQQMSGGNEIVIDFLMQGVTELHLEDCLVDKEMHSYIFMLQCYDMIAVYLFSPEIKSRYLIKYFDTKYVNTFSFYVVFIDTFVEIFMKKMAKIQ